MEKIIQIAGRDVTFKITGALPKRYKMQFQRDFFKDLLSMKKVSGSISHEDIENVMNDINLDIFYDIAWTMAKTADATVPDPLTWLDSFDEFPIVDILPQLQDLLIASITTEKKNYSHSLVKNKVVAP